MTPTPPAPHRPTNGGAPAADSGVNPLEALDLHGTRAAARGNPSMVWRAGQNRRLEMILHWSLPPSGRYRRVLVDGCGVGMYARALLASSDAVWGLDIEAEHLEIAAHNVPGARFQLGAGEALPYAGGAFDLVLSHEVLEHVQDDRAVAGEIVRVLAPGGRAVIFTPNRWYPFETHGHYWRGVYHFGNTPLINYLPDALRDRLAPHVRTYTAARLRALFLGLPVRIVRHTQVYPGYDNLVYRRPALGKWLRRTTYALERSPFAAFGISHLLVVEKVNSER
jgi:SAM-dependent methyltransferase